MTEALPSIVRGTQRVLHRVATTPGLDPLADTCAVAFGRLMRRQPAASEALHGGWLGHAVHPLLTDFTDGPWMGASFLDLFGPDGSSDAARRLVGFGLLASVPTLLSGFLDWEVTEGAERRVGLLHAATSIAATALYGCSYLARRRGRQRAGAVLGLLGGTVAFVDGYIGGELSLVGRIGTGRRLGHAAAGPQAQ